MSVEIEATVATGFEFVALGEVQERFGVNTKTKSQGHITWMHPVESVNQILQLRTVDNFFVIMNRFENLQFSGDKDSDMKMVCNLASQVDWQTGVKIWKKLNPKLACTLDGSTPTDGAKISPSSTSPTQTVHDYQPREKIARLSTSTANDLKDSAVEVDNCAGADIDDSAAEVKDSAGDGSSSVSIDQKDQNPENNANKSSDNASSESSGSNSVDLKAISSMTFRISCNRNGTHSFKSIDISPMFGYEVLQLLPWTVSLKDFMIEVVVTVEGNEVRVALALTKVSLHRRNITHLGKTTLRSTLCAALARLCQLQPGEVVCDPMCGSGAIPVEIALNYPLNKVICGDIDNYNTTKSLGNFTENAVDQSGKGGRPLGVSLLQWDARKLPLVSSSLDVVVTDLPFGKRVGNRASNWHLYPAVLTEMARVVKPSSGRACLLAQDKKCMSKTLDSMKKWWFCNRTVTINHGGMKAVVYVLTRTARLV